VKCSCAMKINGQQGGIDQFGLVFPSKSLCLSSQAVDDVDVSDDHSFLLYE